MAKRKKKSKKSAGSLTLRQVSVLLKKKRQTLSKLEAQKQLLEDKLDAVEAKMAAITASSAGGAKKAKLASARRGRPRKSSNAVTLASLIDQILAHAGRPMRIPDHQQAVPITGPPDAQPHRACKANKQGPICAYCSGQASGCKERQLTGALVYNSCRAWNVRRTFGNSVPLLDNLWHGAYGCQGQSHFGSAG